MHQMQLKRSYPSGAELWVCPHCQRKTVVEWKPVYKRIVLEDGNEGVEHSGSKGGLQMYPPQVKQGPNETAN